MLLQESWKSLKKFEEAWKSFKTLAATDSSCSSFSSCDVWFETCDQSTTSRILTPISRDKSYRDSNKNYYHVSILTVIAKLFEKYTTK